MFHFTHHTRYDKRTRGQSDIAVGDWVQSRYAAPWQGVVLALNPNGGIATVRQVLSRRGVPIRKPRTVQYHCNWFKKVPKPTT